MQKKSLSYDFSKNVEATEDSVLKQIFTDLGFAQSCNKKDIQAKLQINAFQRAEMNFLLMPKEKQLAHDDLRAYIDEKITIAYTYAYPEVKGRNGFYPMEMVTSIRKGLISGGADEETAEMIKSVKLEKLEKATPSVQRNFYYEEAIYLNRLGDIAGAATAFRAYANSDDYKLDDNAKAIASQLANQISSGLENSIEGPVTPGVGLP